METRRCLRVLMLLLSLDAASPGDSPPGLLCVNDYVNAVTCRWSGPARPPGANCSVTGVKNVWVRRDRARKKSQMRRSCWLQPGANATLGCTFAFEDQVFNSYGKLPFIRMECDGTAVVNLTGYEPRRHVKMNPPGVPAVNATDRDTWIRWGPGGGRRWSNLTPLEFHAQIRREGQPWTEARDLHARDPEVKVPSQEVRGRWVSVRVRVRPGEPPNEHWSDWSPTASWLGSNGSDRYEGPPMNLDLLGSDPGGAWLLDPLLMGLVVSTGLVCVVFLALYAGCLRKRVYREKPVPNPSKYFCTLQTLYEGNLKAWLNPTEAFFTTQPTDGISAVEVCRAEGAGVSPASPPSDAAAGGPVATDTSGSSLSSSSSSFYSNIGYFLPSSSCGSAPTAFNPPYFTYPDEGDAGKAGNAGNAASLCSARSYESLAREPQSPDSGFGFGKEDEAEGEDEEAPGGQTCPLLVLPLRHPAPHLAPARPCSGDPDPDPDPDEGGSVCRSTSMNAQPCRTGYLTLKEVHMTFSNKSI